MSATQSLLAGKSVTFKRAKTGYISERTHNRLFNELHRTHGVHSMRTVRISENQFLIRASTHDGRVIIDSFIYLED